MPKISHSHSISGRTRWCSSALNRPPKLSCAAGKRICRLHSKWKSSPSTVYSKFIELINSTTDTNLLASIIDWWLFRIHSPTDSQAHTYLVRVTAIFPSDLVAVRAPSKKSIYKWLGLHARRLEGLLHVNMTNVHTRTDYWCCKFEWVVIWSHSRTSVFQSLLY